MSIADHFEQASDSSYMREYSGRTARRQWDQSLMLMAVIVMVTVTVGLTLRFDQPSTNAREVSTGVVGAQPAPPPYVGKL